MAQGRSSGMLKGKRDFLAQLIYWSGGHFLMNCLPAQNSLLILVYHRIGNSSEDPFDPGVFSATGDQLDEQVKYLKKNFSLITLEEAKACIHGTVKENSRRCRVLITFDDGYLDNYQVAFPILRSHGAQGVFFLSTGLIGSSVVPWWDEIAFRLKTARKPQFSLRYPTDLSVDIVADGLQLSIRKVIDHYKNPQNKAPRDFMDQVRAAAQSEKPLEPTRRFLNWDEAKEMASGGMAIGSHCHSHSMLSKLDLEQQSYEMTHARSVLRERLGGNLDSIAYPVGIKGSFSDETQMLAQASGYEVAFSFYGGVNLLNRPMNPFDVKRVGVSGVQDQVRFRVQAATSRLAGRFWP